MNFLLLINKGILENSSCKKNSYDMIFICLETLDP